MKADGLDALDSHLFPYGWSSSNLMLSAQILCGAQNPEAYRHLIGVLLAIVLFCQLKSGFTDDCARTEHTISNHK